MLRDCTVFHALWFLQMTCRLSLLLLLPVLPALTLCTVMEYAKFEQIDFGATVHASFDELEPIHIAFQRAITPLKSQPRKDGIFVLLHTRHKRIKCFKLAGLHGLQPSIKLLSCALTHHLQKRFYQGVSRLKVWASLPQLPECLSFFWLQILWPAEKEPGSLLCRE